MNTVTVHHPGREEVVALKETYRGFNIVTYMDSDACIMVHDPKQQTLYVVGLDDSKSSGKRIFREEDNTIEAAKQYIDHVIESRSSALVKQLRKVNEPLFNEFKAYLAANYRDWRSHPTDKDIAGVRWFCHQSEQEQLGYLIAFLDQRNGNTMFNDMRNEVIEGFSDKD